MATRADDQRLRALRMLLQADADAAIEHRVPTADTTPRRLRGSAAAAAAAGNEEAMMALLDGGARLGPEELPRGDRQAAVGARGRRRRRRGGHRQAATADGALRAGVAKRRFANLVPLHKMNTYDICVRLREAGLREATANMERRITGRDVYELSPDALLRRLGSLAASSCGLGWPLFQAIQALAGVIWLRGTPRATAASRAPCWRASCSSATASAAGRRCSCSATPPTPSRSSSCAAATSGSAAGARGATVPTLGPFEHHGGAVFALQWARIDVQTKMTSRRRSCCATLVDAAGRLAGGFCIDSRRDAPPRRRPPLPV